MIFVWGSMRIHVIQVLAALAGPASLVPHFRAMPDECHLFMRRGLFVRFEHYYHNLLLTPLKLPYKGTCFIHKNITEDLKQI